MKDIKTKPPYTGPSQLVTEEFSRKVTVVVFKQARRMVVIAGTTYNSPAKDNLSADKHPELWAMACLLCNPKNEVAKNKHWIKLTLQELEAADQKLGDWARQSATQAFFSKQSATQPFFNTTRDKS